MSCSSIYAVPNKGNIYNHEIFSNSHLFAITIWDNLCKEYLNDLNLLMCSEKDCDQLWSLITDKRLPLYKRIVLGLTFDKTIVQQENFPKNTEALKIWSKNNPLHSTRMNEIAVSIEKLMDTPDLFGLYIMCTSVSGITLQMPYNEDDLENLYDISKCDDHKLLFEEYNLAD